MRHLLWAIALAAVTVGPIAGWAEVVQLNGPDGTVYFTNTPRDPRYRRIGIAPVAPVIREAVARGGQASGAGSFKTRGRDAGIGAQIRDAADRYGVPEELVRAVIRVESGFNPRAVSGKGALGLMQLMPATASQLGVRDVFDTAENIDGGVRHLRGLIERFDNNLPFALAAYNAGERAVMQYGGIPPYPETEQYVARILNLVEGGDVGTPMPAAPGLTPTYHFVEADGTTVYTNLSRRPR